MELVLVGRVDSDGIDIQVDEPGLLVVGVEVDYHQDHVSCSLRVGEQLVVVRVVEGDVVGPLEGTMLVPGLVQLGDERGDRVWILEIPLPDWYFSSCGIPRIPG